MKEELQRTKHYRPSPADKPSQFSTGDTNPGNTQDDCDGSERHCGGEPVSSSFTHVVMSDAVSLMVNYPRMRILAVYS